MPKNAWNQILGEVSISSWNFVRVSKALGTGTKFQLEILISTISPIHKFRENILESSRNVNETLSCYLNSTYIAVIWQGYQGTRTSVPATNTGRHARLSIKPDLPVNIHRFLPYDLHCVLAVSCSNRRNNVCKLIGKNSSTGIQYSSESHNRTNDLRDETFTHVPVVHCLNVFFLWHYQHDEVGNRSVYKSGYITPFQTLAT